MATRLAEALRVLVKDIVSRPGGRCLLASGGALLLSGLLHAGWAALAGATLEGPLSIRKPALFGAATGVTLLSLAWVETVARRRGASVAIMTSIAALLEVALISIQYWRGVPSHFNLATPVDAVIAWSIEGCAGLLTLGVALYTARSFVGPITGATSRSMRLALRFGLLTLTLGCLFGVFMVAFGHYARAVGSAPGGFGDAGVLKFVHGTLLHNVQLLPLFVWALERQGLDPTRVTRLTWRALAIASMFILYTIVQTFSGASRFEPTGAGELIALATLGLGLELLVQVVNALTSARSRTRRERCRHVG